MATCVSPCRIGHAYSADDLLIGKEKAIEDRLWAAVLALEEMAALLQDLDVHFARHDRVDRRALYQERRAQAVVQAEQLRRFAEDNRPIHLGDPLDDRSEMASQ
jgi:two-component system, chemotaxis family, protein-glutamate methylesterase/glutaminase